MAMAVAGQWIWFIPKDKITELIVIEPKSQEYGGGKFARILVSLVASSLLICTEIVIRENPPIRHTLGDCLDVIVLRSLKYG